MCGIIGLVGAQYTLTQDVGARLVQGLHHRGPDDSGVWLGEDAGVLLGHTRLAIVDLSPAGHQPMNSACGRYVMIFNGEIYNHMALRAELGSRSWRGHSDTETLLAYFEEKGAERTFSATVGMFALAIWDKQTRKIILGRDRLGEKPLYYGYVGGAFAFASDLAPLRTLPGFAGEIDRQALALYMRHNCVPAPHSIYRGIGKLPPGCWAELSLDAANRNESPVVQAYWSVDQAVERGRRSRLSFDTDREATDALERVLGDAVEGQMMADVPLGAFLSGGIDSSTVVALMQARSARPVETFSIGFGEQGYNEAEHAKAVAKHLGTEHTELYVTANDALSVIPKLARIYSEPFADSSQIPTFLVAEMARKRVTVALSGDGGDELFGGYTRYLMVSTLWKRLERLPVSVRNIAARMIRVMPVSAWNSVLGAVDRFVPVKYRLSLPGDKLHKAAGVLGSTDGADLYRNLVSHWSPETVVLGATESAHASARSSSNGDLTEMMMAIDAQTYLPDDILAKVDRAAMAVSLETRVPMLDHRVFEFAWQLPQSYKVRDGVGKWLLRQVLCRHVPSALIDRPKMGFGVPINSWLRGPLREWTEELLSESRLRRDGFFHPDPIRKKLHEHLSGQRNWQYQLWDVLMFQAWLDTQTSSSVDVPPQDSPLDLIPHAGN